VRERPAGARVIFGDRRSDDDKDRKRPGVAKNLRGDDDRRGRDDDKDRGRRGSEEADDPTLRRPGSWPEMMSAIALTQGRRTDDVRRWLGSAAVSVRYDDVDGDRRPERATWFDRAGQVVQVWVDLDRDGFADTIKLYRDGKLIRVYEK
jgi:hypothetical protein